ncbi:MAG: hypothetical protein KAI17_01580, partial [Thiotrichaceae bacterium]|nr:hypothetical protein [Thiotrichaceae bacterium]
MNETKEKIRAMINEETTAKRKEELAERRSKKDKKPKAEKISIPMDDKKKSLFRSIAFFLLLSIFALALFYGASINKENAEKEYLLQLENKAKQELTALVKQSAEMLALKISNFDYILKDAEYIKNFNDASWQDVLKIELETRFGGQALVEIVAADFKDDDIIDNPAMGYSILSILNEFKTSAKKQLKNNLKIEAHGLKGDDSRIVFIKKATYTDMDLKKEVLIGYIIVKIPRLFINQLINGFNIQTDYLEVVQSFSGKSILLVKAGDQSLKNMSLSVSEKLANTQWVFKFWPVEQTSKVPFSLMWQAILFLVLGVLSIIASLFFLIRFIKNYKSDNYIAVPPGQNNKTVLQDATTSKSGQPVYNKESGISVDDSSESEYLTLIMEKIFKAYDIRGVVGEFINAEIFQKISYAIAKEMEEQQQTQISIGYDGRNSSPELAKAMIDALLESGINVLDIG